MASQHNKGDDVSKVCQHLSVAVDAYKKHLKVVTKTSQHLSLILSNYLHLEMPKFTEVNQRAAYQMFSPLSCL